MRHLAPVLLVLSVLLTGCGDNRQAAVGLPSNPEVRIDFIGQVRSTEYFGGPLGTFEFPSQEHPMPPMTITLTDGRVLDVPEGTLGGNACVWLLHPDDFDYFDPWWQQTISYPTGTCVVIGQFAVDETVAWFAVRDASSRGGETISVDVVRLDEQPFQVRDGEVVMNNGWVFSLTEGYELKCPSEWTIEDALENGAEAVIDLASESVISIQCQYRA